MARIGVPKWQLWPSRRCFSTSAFRFDKKADLEAHQKNVMARGLPKKRALPNVQHVVLVASGKGGVGKSTTAVNLALALSKQNKEVGIFDADIYGPSIPLMLNIRGLQPDLNQQKAMIPLQVGKNNLILTIDQFYFLFKELWSQMHVYGIFGKGLGLCRGLERTHGHGGHRENALPGDHQ